MNGVIVLISFETLGLILFHVRNLKDIRKGRVFMSIIASALPINAFLKVTIV